MQETSHCWPLVAGILNFWPQIWNLRKKSHPEQEGRRKTIPCRTFIFLTAGHWNPEILTSSLKSTQKSGPEPASSVWDRRSRSKKRRGKKEEKKIAEPAKVYVSSLFSVQNCTFRTGRRCKTGLGDESLGQKLGQKSLGGPGPPDPPNLVAEENS